MTVKKQRARAKGNRPWGSTTVMVVQAILAGADKLPLIVLTTGEEYRKINATVYALEKQSRVVAVSYDVPRCEQTFKVIHPEPIPRAERNAAGLHPSSKRAAVPKLDAIWHGIAAPSRTTATDLPKRTHRCIGR